MLECPPCDHESELPLLIDDSKARGRYEALNENYIRSVSAAGGLPLLLPVLADKAEIADCAASIDGLLLSGGGDVLPLR